jgi:enoyl-CoA hydratase/carnithine racemase
VVDVDVPTIAVINGPGPRMEIALMCDLTLCTPQTVFADGNFGAGSVPGDGMYLALSELAGPKRSAYLAYTGTGLSADEARDLGNWQRRVVNDLRAAYTAQLLSMTR